MSSFEPGMAAPVDGSCCSRDPLRPTVCAVAHCHILLYILRLFDILYLPPSSCYNFHQDVKLSQIVDDNVARHSRETTFIMIISSSDVSHAMGSICKDLMLLKL